MVVYGSLGGLHTLDIAGLKSYSTGLYGCSFKIVVSRRMPFSFLSQAQQAVLVSHERAGAAGRGLPSA